ncbi:hypothetical protein [Mycobacterium paraintracellulare]|uniref:hypothetical protein n=1 Tax=Mycobacterium paraintracellulare TaxID=1138383 RepID=UPI00192861C8|nr:hypothetical protein [Mycobacterium paraintracellulare]
MKIREMIARSLLVGSLAGAALGLGAGPLVWSPPTPDPEPWEAPPPPEEGAPLPPR